MDLSLSNLPAPARWAIILTVAKAIVTSPSFSSYALNLLLAPLAR